MKSRFGSRNLLLAVLCFALGFIVASALYANLLLITNAEQSESAPAPTMLETGPVVERQIPIVAVTQDGQGQMGTLRVKLIPGNANVLIDTNPFLETDIQYSANMAVTLAKMRTGMYVSDRDFILTYESNAPVIGGGSAGAATAVAVIAALEDRALRDDAIVTGEIYPDGTIGRIGGVMEKAKAVADAGYSRFLIPKGQGTITYYERVVSEEPGFGYWFYNARLVPRTIDIIEIAAQEWGLEVVEVATIDDVVDEMLV